MCAEGWQSVFGTLSPGKRWTMLAAQACVVRLEYFGPSWAGILEWSLLSVLRIAPLP
jgi:hypothetical protein